MRTPLFSTSLRKLDPEVLAALVGVEIPFGGGNVDIALGVGCRTGTAVPNRSQVFLRDRIENAEGRQAGSVIRQHPAVRRKSLQPLEPKKAM